MPVELDEINTLLSQRDQMLESTVINCGVTSPKLFGGRITRHISCPLPETMMPEISGDEYYDSLEDMAAASTSVNTVLELLTPTSDIKPEEVEVGGTVYIKKKCLGNCSFRTDR